MTYPYRDLDLPRETRILILQPSENRDDDIICSLVHVDIEAECGSYDALSYCWSKSVSNPPDLLDKSIDCELDTSSGRERQRFKPRDLLGHPQLEYLYIKYGGVLPDGVIFCDGVGVRVGGELFRALRHFRKLFSKGALRLWVDALCINQTNIEERNEHVKVMGNIYSKAALVSIWLGESIGIEYEVAQALEHIGFILEDKLPDGFPWPDNDTGDRTIQDDPRWNAVNWVALSQFLGRAWFDRIWVVQEVFNARHAQIHAGNVVMPWDYVAVFLGYVRGLGLDHNLSHPSSSKALATMTTLRTEKIKQGFSQFDLACILEEVRNLQASITSDKVYGALGLPSDPYETAFIQVDYAKTTEEVFTDVAIDYLQRRNSLAILSHCVISTRSKHSPGVKLPSWVPDWSAPGWTEPFRNRKLPCKASGNTAPHILEINRRAGILRLRGRLLDTVRAVDYTAQIPEFEFAFPEHPGAATREEQFTKLKALEKEERANIFLLAITNSCTSSDEKNSTFIWDSTKHESLWRAYMCNRTRGGSLPEKELEGAWDYLLKYSLHFVRHYSGFKYQNKTSMSPPALEIAKLLAVTAACGTKEEIMEYRRTNILDKVNLLTRGHRTWTYHRRFFVSSNGRFGWGVDGTKVGDEVVMFYGCDYPFVMRRGEDGRGWRIVGDCYIHGLMDGEGLGHGFEERDFVIV